MAKPRWPERTHACNRGGVPSVATGEQRGQVGAVGKRLGNDARLGAHGGAGHVADIAVGAAVVAVGEAAEGCRGRHGGRHEHGDEEEGDHSHLGARHGGGIYGEAELRAGVME